MDKIESILKGHMSPVFNYNGKVDHYLYLKTDFSELVEEIEKLFDRRDDER